MRAANPGTAQNTYLELAAKLLQGVEAALGDLLKGHEQWVRGVPTRFGLRRVFIGRHSYRAADTPALTGSCRLLRDTTRMSERAKPITDLPERVRASDQMHYQRRPRRDEGGHR